MRQGRAGLGSAWRGKTIQGKEFFDWMFQLKHQGVLEERDR
jgi:hypothetical protein